MADSVNPFFEAEDTELRATELRENTVQHAMLPNEYQAQAMEHVMASAPDYESRITLGAMGLSREASEVAELVERWLFFGQELDTNKLRDELGDVLWYMALLCEMTDQTLSQVIDHNVEKLNRRYPNGYSHEAWENDRRARGIKVE